MATPMFRPRPGDSLSSHEYDLSAAVTDVPHLPGQLAFDVNGSVGPFVDPHLVVLAVLIGFFLLYVAIVVFETLSERVLGEGNDPTELLGRS